MGTQGAFLGPGKGHAHLISTRGYVASLCISRGPGNPPCSLDALGTVLCVCANLAPGGKRTLIWNVCSVRFSFLFGSWGSTRSVPLQFGSVQFRLHAVPAVQDSILQYTTVYKRTLNPKPDTLKPQILIPSKKCCWSTVLYMVCCVKMLRTWWLPWLLGLAYPATWPRHLVLFGTRVSGFRGLGVFHQSLRRYAL